MAMFKKGSKLSNCKTKNIFLFILSLILCCSCTVTHKPVIDIYVIPSSEDSGRDNIDEPYHNLIQAIHSAREFKNQPVNIWLREGEYFLKETLKLTNLDSRFPHAPLTISAYKDESVILTGAIKLPYWNKVVDSAVLSQLSGKAKGAVQVTNLKQYGITNFGSPRGGGVELFYNDEKMQISRYPNNKNLTISKLVEPNSKIIRSHKGSVAGKFYYQGDFAERWSKEKDIWLHGYWFWDWKDENQQVKNINTASKTIQLNKPYHYYGYRKGQEYYAYNLLSEIDEPNEWYLDRDNGNLYYYPSQELNKHNYPEVSVLNNLIEINEVSNIVIKNITIAFARGNAITIKQGNNNSIENISVKHIGNTGVVIRDSYHSQIIDSELYSIGGTAIIIKGGDRASLTSANACAINNKIHNYATIKRTYHPGISLSGVGNCARNNEIFNAPHIAIFFSGNNHKIEYNDIHHVVKKSNDAGAIYAGRDWTARGNVIKYNFLHDITGLNNKGAKGIYLDDEFSGVTIYGNIFDNVHDAVFIGGGRDNLVVNNLFINSEPSIHIDARGVGWAKSQISQLMNKLNKVPYQSEIWKNEYPALGDVLQINHRLPVGNVIKNNVFFDKKWSGISTKAVKHVHLESNYFLFGEQPTDNYQIENNQISFVNIPYSNIRLQG